LIHGYPFEHSMWFSTIASLGANARVIVPDLPGFGKNPVRYEEEPFLEVMADYLAELLDQNQQERVIVAGMSMGGYVALSFAEKYSTRTRGLGLISSQAAADTPEARQGRYEMVRKIKEMGPAVAVEALLPKLFSDARANKPELKEYAIAGAHAAGADGLSWSLEAMAKRPDRTAFLRSLRIPVLIVHGSDDKIIPGVKARQLAEDCQKPILVELRGVGHASPLEAPDQVASALARLVQKCHEDDTRFSRKEKAGATLDAKG
jgi:3-oxoadipate enol-lactonase